MLTGLRLVFCPVSDFHGQDLNMENNLNTMQGDFDTVAQRFI